MTPPDSPPTKDRVQDEKELYCSVKNCRKKLDKDEAVVIGGKIYCRRCASLIFAQNFL